jgi:hypothetical protein
MRDRAVRSLLASNLLTLALAVWQRWPLVVLLWPYWVQSIVIGWYARKRILAARDYRIGTPISIDRRQMRREEWPQRRLASFSARMLMLRLALGGACSEEEKRWSAFCHTLSPDTWRCRQQTGRHWIV